MVRTAVLLAVMLIAAPAALAQPTLSSAADAEAYLDRQGLTPLSPLEPVGDYWQGRARKNGEDVLVFLFDDGTLWVRARPDLTLKAVVGRNGVLHPIS